MSSSKLLSVTLVVSLLIAVAVSLVGYKVFVLEFPIAPDSSSRYFLIEAHLSFEGVGKPTKASLFLPRTSSRFLLSDESFVSRGYGLTTSERGENRVAEWTTRRATGTQGLYYRALVLVRPEGHLAKPKDRGGEIAVAPVEGPEREVILSILADGRQRSADAKSLVQAIISIVNERASAGHAKPLIRKGANNTERIRAVVAILREANVPARVVRGIIIAGAQGRAEPTSRIHVQTEDGWHIVDADGQFYDDSIDFLPWWFGSDNLVSAQGARGMRVSVSYRQTEEEAVDTVLRGNQTETSALVRFSLLRLPLEAQSIFRVLLLVPFGALLIVILRNIVGIKLPGTFMPVLLALAFRGTSLGWGILIFSVLTAIGLFARSGLERLRLLLLPRVGGVLTIVVLLMVVISMVANELGLEVAISVALFPMVVITMMIERTAIMWEELGPKDALRQWINGTLGAIAVYYVITPAPLGYFLLLYPEVLLIVLAAMIVLGRYTGYRLSEIRRFKDVAR
jgi:hypothetical protein